MFDCFHLKWNVLGCCKKHENNDWNAGCCKLCSVFVARFLHMVKIQYSKCILPIRKQVYNFIMIRLFVRYILLNYSHRCKYLPTLQFNLRRINVSLGLHIECIATNYEDVHSRKVISHTLIDRLIWNIMEERRFYLLQHIYWIGGNTESRSPINFLSYYKGWLDKKI